MARVLRGGRGRRRAGVIPGARAPRDGRGPELRRVAARALRRRHAGVGDVRSRAGRARGGGREEGVVAVDGRRGGIQGSVDAVGASVRVGWGDDGWWVGAVDVFLSAGRLRRREEAPPGGRRRDFREGRRGGAPRGDLVDGEDDSVRGRHRGGDWRGFRLASEEHSGRGGGCRQRRRRRRRHHARLTRRQGETRQDRCAGARQGAHRARRGRQRSDGDPKAPRRRSHHAERVSVGLSSRRVRGEAGDHRGVGGGGETSRLRRGRERGRRGQLPRRRASAARCVRRGAQKPALVRDAVR